MEQSEAPTKMADSRQDDELEVLNEYTSGFVPWQRVG
jgi:hypothetical protein